MLIPILLFAVGLVMLIKGGDWFVDGSIAVAHRLHIPELIIGATIVSIGTTLPEVLVSTLSAIDGHGQIAYGNAIGSIICNTSLIAALTVAIRPGTVNRKSFSTPVAFFFGAAALYCAVAYITGRFSRPIGAVLLLIFVAFMSYTIWQGKKDGSTQTETEEDNEDEMSPIKSIALLIIGAALIAGGARLLVDNGTILAEKAGVPESVIGLTVVALGTSLPELATAVTSLVKGHSSLSLGNIIGANLFNLVLVSGLSTLLAPFDIPAERTIGGHNASLVVDIPVMFFVMALLTLPTLFCGKLKRYQGIILLTVYVGFCLFQFIG